MGDRVGARLAGIVDGELGDQGPPEGGEQRVTAAVEGIRLDRWQQKLLGELLTRINHMALECAKPHCLALDHLVILPGLAKIDGQANDLRVVGVLDPLQHHARIQTP